MTSQEKIILNVIVWDYAKRFKGDCVFAYYRTTYDDRFNGFFAVEPNGYKGKLTYCVCDTMKCQLTSHCSLIEIAGPCQLVDTSDGVMTFMLEYIGIDNALDKCEHWTLDVEIEILK